MQRKMASGYAEQVTADVAALGGEHLRQCFDRRKLGQEEPRYLSHKAGGRTSSEEASAVPLSSNLFSSLLTPDSHNLWGNCAHPKVSQLAGLCSV